MKTQNVEYLNWNIDIYYNVSKKNSSFLIDELADNKCSGEALFRAYRIITSKEYDQGLTFVNPFNKKIIVIICKHSSKYALLNTLMHELYHCSDFIAKFSDKDDPEYPAYILGDLSQKVLKNVNII